LKKAAIEDLLSDIEKV